jgi:organic radical activating enzyme
MKGDSASLAEVFSSIQGEGALVGRRQIFIRFLGCNLACDYCDTNSVLNTDVCRLELTPGRRDFHEMQNPVDMERIVDLVSRWSSGWPSVHHSISLTGGEPLLHLDVLQDWLGKLRAILPLHLETNGVLHNALFAVIRHIDYISMDIKLPSSSGEDSLWEHHREFLAIAADSNLSVKVVVNSATEPWEISRAAEMVASISPAIPFIIQPETKAENSIDIPILCLLELQEIAARNLRDVRLIPQTHRFMGML